MVIQCPECTTRFKVAAEKIKPDGIKVRCAKCRHIFAVLPEVPVPAVDATADWADQADLAAAADELWGDGDLMAALDAPAAPLAEEAPDLGVADSDAWGSVFEAETLAAGAERTAVSAGELDEFAEIPDGASAEFELDETALGLDTLDGEPAPAGAYPTTSTIALDEIVFAGEEPESATVTEEFATPAVGGAGEYGLDAFAFGPESVFAEAASAAEGDRLSADDLLFPLENEGAAKAAGSQALPFEQSRTDEFSFDGSGSETDGPLPFMEDDVFGEGPLPGTPELFQGPGKGIEFDEPPGPDGEGRAFDFDDLSFAADGAAAPSAEAEELIAPVLKPAPPPKAERQPAGAGSFHEEAGGSHDVAPITPRKSPLSGVLRLFLLLLLVLLAVAGYLVWQGGGSLEPLLGQLTGQPAAAPESGQIRLPLPHSFFVGNREAGQLFVVQGEAVNGYLEARSAITVKGMLRDAKGQVLMQQTVFCGNPLTLDILKTASFAQIEESMNNQFGKALSNLNVAPGKAIPYMIVFRNLPPEVTEFTVEVVDSRTGDQP